MRSICLAFLMSFLGISAASCRSVDELYQGTGDVIEVSGKSYEDVWRTCLKVVDDSYVIRKAQKEAGEIRAETSIVDGGMATEVVAVFITPARDSETHRVEVVSKARTSLGIGNNSSVFKKFQKDLKNAISQELQ